MTFTLSTGAVSLEQALACASELEQVVGEIANNTRKADRIPLEPLARLVQFVRNSANPSQVPSTARPAPSAGPTAEDILHEALEKIAAIENEMYGHDWDEIEKARTIANEALAKAALLATSAAATETVQTTALTGALLRKWWHQLQPLTEMQTEEEVAAWWKHYAGSIRHALRQAPELPGDPPVAVRMLNSVAAAASAKPRYKNAQHQALFDNMLKLANDLTSEMYWEGRPRRGAGHRAAFWDGYSGKFDFQGPKRSAHVIPGTMSAVCFMAGREFARQQKKTSRA